MPVRSTRTLAWALTILAAAAYAALAARYAPAAMQDLPNHLARASLIGDLLFQSGTGIGQNFEFHVMAVPYLLHDLLLAVCIEFFGAQGAAMLWVAAVLLSLPIALLVYARGRGVRAGAEPVLFLLGLYLSTNTCYWRGFLAYSLGLSWVLLALAAADRWRAGPRASRFALYAGFVTAGYFTHLSALVFVTGAVAVAAGLRVLRNRSERRELLLLIPPAAWLLWHCAGHGLPEITRASGPHWPTAWDKLSGADWSFLRFDRVGDSLLLCAALACLAAQMRLERGGRSAAPPSGARALSPRGEMLGMAAAFTAAYLVLPHSLGSLSWLDMRAVPLVALFLTVACFVPAERPATTLAPAPGPPERAPAAAPSAMDAIAHGAALARPEVFRPARARALRHSAPSSRAWGALPLGLALALTAANLGDLRHHLRALDTWLTDYRRVVAAVPGGAWVLPVYTNTRDRPVRSTLHAAAYTLLDRGALTPYLFSRDLGDAMPYFGYRHRPYAPDEVWYLEADAEPQRPDWAAIAASYRYLLVMKPYDPARIPIKTSTVRESPAATLLEIKPTKLAVLGD